MTTRAVVAIGADQCVKWGVLYYAFAVLVRPLERELGARTWTVTAAFSLALLMSAVLAPTVGRWGDRDLGARTIQIGGFAAAALLAAWTVVPGVPALYVVWAGLGLCMAATLYEPAFVIVGRAHADTARRVRALAIVTLLGGLASTVFLPVTALLVEWLGWRGAVLVLAASLVASTTMARRWAFVELRGRMPRADTPRPALLHEAGSSASGRWSSPPAFPYVAVTFASMSLASAGFVTNLVPALGERGVPPEAAAMLGGSVGVMQLPGRALMLSGAFAASPSRLLTASLALLAIGLAGVALGPSRGAVAAGTMIFALGSGLTTLVRPHVVQTMFEIDRRGALNGRIARLQQLARAAGPLVTAWLAGVASYSAAFTAMAVAFGVAAVVPAILFRSDGRARRPAGPDAESRRRLTYGR